MHGLPYPETEHSEWPGYMPFMPAGKLPGFGDAWGERQPQWTREWPSLSVLVASIDALIQYLLDTPIT
jgi:hypothetical protein